MGLDLIPFDTFIVVSYQLWDDNSFHLQLFKFCYSQEVFRAKCKE